MEVRKDLVVFGICNPHGHLIVETLSTCETWHDCPEAIAKSQARDLFLQQEKLRWWRRVLIPKKTWQFYELLGYSAKQFFLTELSAKVGDQPGVILENDA